MSEAGYVIAPGPRPSVAVAGTAGRWPVRRIYCVGRNYAAHVEEMGGTLERNPPIFFQKPADAVVASGETIAYPTITGELHHEVELVLAIGKGGRNIPEATALDHVWGYAVALDMTRRDIQGGGKPWEIAKSFDQSCPIGAITPAAVSGSKTSGCIRLTVNGETRQESDLSLLIWKLPEIVARLSEYFELRPGDLVLTGTPHGVGPVVTGDRLVATVDGLAPLDVTIGPRAG
ncbi:fumarylacetoacetate hydrolase family protein [Amaricoccus sp.]|uniref:fumarylacetoacetate hydrolase family protein n=1 Tax=Amaricoccus sp. TaxID=1872485 RepID=UPI001B405D75|nr:fumarylacetoacetate hydrolase family protein [Amaricoccus sp.]MBP7001680.1 fumarylacetoacetate hydrolase family protein [Amaricoccus sp.]